MNNNLTLHPWSTIWIQPKSTIQQIIDTDPKFLVLVLSMINGIVFTLNRSGIKDLGDKIEFSTILLLCGILGPFLGVIWLYLISSILTWSGKLLGGNASSENIRSAVAWSYIPVCVLLVLWALELVVFGAENFTSATPNIDSNKYLYNLLIGFDVLESIMHVWGTLIFIYCLSQVQGFTPIKSMLSILFLVLILIYP